MSLFFLPKIEKRKKKKESSKWGCYRLDLKKTAPKQTTFTRKVLVLCDIGELMLLLISTSQISLCNFILEFRKALVTWYSLNIAEKDINGWKTLFVMGLKKAKHVDKLSEGSFNDKITMYTVSCSSLFPFEIGRSCINFRFSATYS